MSEDRFACRYRITLGPRGGRGSFRMQYVVTLSMDVIVEMGELDCLLLQAAKAAEDLMGRDAGALTATRVEREVNGAWHERKWPIPVACSVDDLVFSREGELLTNVIPTWPR